MSLVVIALGSNLGDSVALISGAIDKLSSVMSVEVVSSAYATEPMYVVDQPEFVNAALIGYTDLGPRELLSELKLIEQEIGRQPRERNGPREIDVDLIAYSQLRYTFTELGEAKLQLPHTRLAERAFVLKPLAEICPDFNIPGLGTVSQLLDNLGGAADSARVIPDAILPLHRR